MVQNKGKSKDPSKIPDTTAEEGEQKAEVLPWPTPEQGKPLPIHTMNGDTVSHFTPPPPPDQGAGLVQIKSNVKAGNYTEELTDKKGK